MPGPRYTRIIAALPATVPFTGPETQERQLGRAFVARLGANESAFGPSPRAIAAMERAAREVWMYGDPEAFELKAALAAHHGVAQGNIVIGEGIDGLLGNLVRLLVEPGDPVVTSDGAYPTFNFHVAAQGGTLYKVPYRETHEDPDALVAKAAETQAKLVYLANPDNPMGSWHMAGAIEAALDRLPEGCLLALDEAYADLAPQDSLPAMAAEDPRLIRLRTFSKGYGMAGARIGYAIAAAPLIAAFDKVRNHFGVGRIAQAGALAALADQAWLAQVRAKFMRAKSRIARIAREFDLTPLPSATNFVTIDLKGDAALARATVAALARRGVFVRMPFAPPHDRCIRVSAGRDADLDAFAAALPEALAEALAVTRT